jgi:hypothetical protein
LRELGLRSGNPSVPVIGPRTVAQLEEQIAALDVTLDNEQFDRLDQASAIAMGAPHDLVAGFRASLRGDEPDRFLVSNEWRS